MIADPIRLREVVEEIAATWTVDQRRTYLKNIETAFGTAAANQIREGLTEMWKELKGKKKEIA